MGDQIVRPPVQDVTRSDTLRRDLWSEVPGRPGDAQAGGAPWTNWLGSGCDDGGVSLNPPTQYANENNLRARQRFWEQQSPPSDIVHWVLDVAGLTPGLLKPRIIDVGCGNGAYLGALRRRGMTAVGVDISIGMLCAARPDPRLVNADATALPFPDNSFGVVLAPHMLYHVANRDVAIAEMRRVLEPSGVCIVVTNGRDHIRALRMLVEEAVRIATPGWQMRNPSTHAFSLENGAASLGTVFGSIAVVRPDHAARVTLTNAAIAADYVASVADHYQSGTDRPWSEVVAAVRQRVEGEIRTNGAFVVAGEIGAFVCRD